MQNNLIAGIGLTHLTVYDQSPAPDGCHSGCAHVHAVTDEAYFVLAGTGAIELHDLEHGLRSVPLAPGSYVQFAPGTLHRAVNNGGLVVLVIMGNAGLAERGDARIWFGADHCGPTVRWPGAPGPRPVSVCDADLNALRAAGSRVMVLPA